MTGREGRRDAGGRPYGGAGWMVSASVPGLLATGGFITGAGAVPMVEVVVDVPTPPVLVPAVLLVPVTLPVMGAVGTVVDKGALFRNAELALACAFRFICCAGVTVVDPLGLLKF